MAALDDRGRSELLATLIEAGRFFHAESLVDSHGGNLSSRNSYKWTAARPDNTAVPVWAWPLPGDW